MTREEAKDILTLRKDMHEETAKALDMAIEALQADTVSREEYEELYHKAEEVNRMANEILADFPSYKELVSVVRCKTCRHYFVKGDTTHFGWCEYWDKPTDEMRFCSIGERREP